MSSAEASCSGAPSAEEDAIELTYSEYAGEEQLQGIIDLISLDLSEPYSIFTYRYFINNWPNLCFNAIAKDRNDPAAPPKIVGTIVCKQDRHRSGALRGYIAMLAVSGSMRKRGMGRQLVKLAVCAMRDSGADEAVLETEVTNTGAMRLYESLGFVRDKRLHRYYLNGNDAFRLKVWFRDLPPPMDPDEPPVGEEEAVRDGAGADGAASRVDMHQDSVEGAEADHDADGAQEGAPCADAVDAN